MKFTPVTLKQQYNEMTYTIIRRNSIPVASDGWTDEYWAKVR